MADVGVAWGADEYAGLMELIVLNIGLELGVISPKLFAIMVVMALVTTMATTPILDWVYLKCGRKEDGEGIRVRSEK